MKYFRFDISILLEMILFSCSSIDQRGTTLNPFKNGHVDYVSINYSGEIIIDYYCCLRTI